MWVAERDPEGRAKTISDHLTEAEQERFRNLLELAARSPYAGERANALAAATRLADRHGLTLEEAARREPSPPRPRAAAPEQHAARESARAEAAAFARAVHMMDAQLKADKARREAALRAARERGLDAETPSHRRPFSRRSGRGWRRNPYAHANVLLRETTLPLRDIVEITGLDIYKIVEIKLKMRTEAAAHAR